MKLVGIRRPMFAAVAPLAATAMLFAAGCSNTEDSPSGAAESSEAVAVTADQALHDKLPQKIKDAGKLVAGVNVPYKPNEYLEGDKIVGFDIDLLDAIATKLGVTVDYKQADFERIIPAVTGGSYDLGVSSFSDTPERQETVDFVNYFNAGIQWAQQAGKVVDPNDACGKTVAVQSNTTEHLDELPAKSKACEDAGKPKIEILSFDSQDEATNALVGGRVDALSADSPVTQYAVKQSAGKLELAGDMFDVVAYGYPVPKESQLAPVLQEALQALIDDGTYLSIVNNWGLEDGALTEATINSGAK